MSKDMPGTKEPRLRVMVVEDEADIGAIIIHLLSGKYEVVHATNGLEALERLSWYQPDITIMDLMMPILDGFDTTRAIKKDNDYSSMPVLFLTARKDNQSVREALMAGGDHYMEKPFDPPELMVRLDEMAMRNNLIPRPKRHTMAEIHREFSGQNRTVDNLPPMGVVPQSLTEQLARAAAEPKARLLFVCDVDQTVRTAKSNFSPEYEFISATDPETSLDKIMAYQPDVVLVSLEMAALNGFHLGQLFRVNRNLRPSNLVFFGSEESPEVHADAARLGGTYVQIRSINLERLTRQINTVVQSPGFRRQRKRLDFREILRREEPTNGE